MSLTFEPYQKLTAAALTEINGATVRRYASTSARDAAIPAPVVGMVCAVGADEYRCITAGAWVLWSRPWGTWTPTVTNMSTSSVVARYQVSARLVHVQIRLDVTAVSGVVSFSMPLTQDVPVAGLPSGEWVATDASAAAVYAGVVVTATGGTVAQLYVQGTAGLLSAVAAANPFTWASGDWLIANLVYAAA